VSAPSPRQQLILEGLARGDDYRTIAEVVALTPRALRNYCSHLFSVLGVTDRAAWVGLAYRRNWLPIEPGPPPAEPLPPQLQCVLCGFALGWSDRRMAQNMGCSTRTLDTRGAAVRSRLGAHHRAHSVALGYQQRHLIVGREELL